MRYLVDTDWVIDYMHGVPELVDRFDGLLPEGVGTSIVSLAELYEGVYGSSVQRSDERRLGNFLSFVDVVPLDDAICRIFAEERSRLRAAGLIIADFDLLIGSTAMRHDLVLLTNNRRHFERIQGLHIVAE